MKSLAKLLISHVFISIFVTFFLLSGHIEHPFLIIFLLFLPVLNKGQRFQKIQSKKIRLLNASLCFILISFPQLLTNPMDWRYLVFLIICIIFSLVYFYTLYQLFKEVNQKSLIQEVTPMKKEDFTTRLLKLFFHIQGPFDECRQEIIYKACARSMVQIVYSSFFLFLFYLLFGRFIEAVRYAMPYVYSGLIFFITLKTQRAVKELHLEKDDKSEIILKTYSKSQIKFRSWVVFIGLQIGLFILLIFHKVFVQQMSLPDFVKLLMQFDKSVPLLMYGLIIGSIFGTLTYGFLSLQEEKTPKNTKQKEKSKQ